MLQQSGNIYFNINSVDDSNKNFTSIIQLVVNRVGIIIVIFKNTVLCWTYSIRPNIVWIFLVFNFVSIYYCLTEWQCRVNFVWELSFVLFKNWFRLVSTGTKMNDRNFRICNTNIKINIKNIRPIIFITMLSLPQYLT